MNILENELVRKYFGCHCPPEQNTLAGYHPENCSDKAIALRILQAMQEPIKKGESYLNSANKNDWIRLDDCPIDIEDFHPFGLRLPDQFQSPKPSTAKCLHKTSGCYCSYSITGHECCGYLNHHIGCICHLQKPCSHQSSPAKECSHCTGILERHQLENQNECLCQCHKTPLYDLVEEKIKEIKFELIWSNDKQAYLIHPLEVRLRELVALARETK